MPIYKLLDFYAEWCAPCRALKPIIESLDIDYEIVDCSTNIIKANEYHVVSIPTLILLKNDEEAGRITKPTPNKEFIENWIKENE